MTRTDVVLIVVHPLFLLSLGLAGAPAWLLVLSAVCYPWAYCDLKAIGREGR